MSLIIGWLVLHGATMLLPLGLDLLDHDPNARTLGVCAVLTMAGRGGVVAVAGRRAEPPRRDTR